MCIEIPLRIDCFEKVGNLDSIADCSATFRVTAIFD